MSKEGSMFDVAIIGGGPAGMQAALVLARTRKKIVLFDDRRPPRNAASHGVHNFLGLDGLPPAEIPRVAWEQIDRYESAVLRHEHIVWLTAGTACLDSSGSSAAPPSKSFKSPSQLIRGDPFLIHQEAVPLDPITEVDRASFGDRVQVELSDYLVAETKDVELTSGLELDQVDLLVPTHEGDPIVMTRHPDLFEGEFLSSLEVDGFLVDGRVLGG